MISSWFNRQSSIHVDHCLDFKVLSITHTIAAGLLSPMEPRILYTYLEAECFHVYKRIKIVEKFYIRLLFCSV